MKKLIKNAILLFMLGFLSAQDCVDDPTGVFDAMGGCETVIGWVGCDGAFSSYNVSDICPASCGTSGVDDPTGAYDAMGGC